MKKEKLEEIKSYIEKLKVIASTSPMFVNGKFLKIASAEYTLANGQTIIREEIVKPNTNAAIILPITSEGKVILIAEPRPLTKEGVTIELPSGYINNNELGYEGAIRELEEETGYITKMSPILLGKFYQDQGCSRALNEAYLILGCKKEHEQQLDKDEFIIHFECTLDEMFELMNLGYIKGSNSLLAIKLGEKMALEYVKKINKNRRKVYV